MALGNKSQDSMPIDYISGSLDYKDSNDNIHPVERSGKIFKAVHALKNSMIYYLLRNRKDKKVKNLRKILEEYIAKEKKKKEFQRQKEREL